MVSQPDDSLNDLRSWFDKAPPTVSTAGALASLFHIDLKEKFTEIYVVCTGSSGMTTIALVVGMFCSLFPGSFCVYFMPARVCCIYTPSS